MNFEQLVLRERARRRPPVRNLSARRGFPAGSWSCLLCQLAGSSFPQETATMDLLTHWGRSHPIALEALHEIMVRR